MLQFFLYKLLLFGDTLMPHSFTIPSEESFEFLSATTSKMTHNEAIDYANFFSITHSMPNDALPLALNVYQASATVRLDDTSFLTVPKTSPASSFPESSYRTPPASSRKLHPSPMTTKDSSHSEPNSPIPTTPTPHVNFSTPKAPSSSKKTTAVTNSSITFETIQNHLEAYQQHIVMLKNTFNADNIKVLIVEDNKSNQKIITRYAKNYINNSNVIIANNGQEAMNALNAEAFAVIFMDNQFPTGKLPDGSSNGLPNTSLGLEIIKKIRAGETTFNKDAFIVIQSGDDPDVIAQLCAAAGAYSCVLANKKYMNDKGINCVAEAFTFFFEEVLKHIKLGKLRA